MNCNLLVYLFLALVSLEICAQTATTLIPYRKGDKWGYCAPDGSIVVDPVYDKVELKPNNGLRRVHQGEKIGCIDAEGKLIIAPEYATISFRPDLIQCGLRTKEDYHKIRFYCYDFNGKKLIKEQLSLVNYLKAQDLYFVRDYTGDEGLFQFTDDNKFVLVIDTIYQRVVPGIEYITCYTEDKVTTFSTTDFSLIAEGAITDDTVLLDDIAPDYVDNSFSIDDQAEGKANLSHMFDPKKDAEGNKILIRLQYPHTKKYLAWEEIKELSVYDTLDITFTGISLQQVYRKFYLDDTIITSKYVAVISDQTGREGLVNGLGEQVLDFDYLKIEYTRQKSDCLVNLFRCQGLNEKWGLADDNGRVVLPTEFDAITVVKNRIIHPVYGGVYCYASVPIFITQTAGKYGLTDTTQQALVPHTMDSIYYDEQKSIFYLQKEGLWGCYSREGLYCPPVYKELPSNILNINDYTIVTFYDRRQLWVCGNTEGTYYYEE